MAMVRGKLRAEVMDVRIGVSIADFSGTTGPRLGSDLAAVGRTLDEAGFDIICVMDHFFQIAGIGPPEADMLEAYTTLGYLAATTARARLLAVVTGVPYRHPGILAKIITTLDVLSGGRAWLGIGAAWYEYEARALGVPFPPLAERFQQLEEALRICLQMWSGDEAPFLGEHFQLDRPLNHPQAITRPHPPIMIGGAGERKTLRLVARYGQACNLFFPGPELPRKLEVLRAHCEAEGRDYNDIEKSVLFHVDVGDRGERAGQMVDELAKVAALGIDTAICNVAGIWDRKPIEIIGSEIIPAVAAL
jgi:F420-dependent oxidoreductase-like protein